MKKTILLTLGAFALLGVVALLVLIVLLRPVFSAAFESARESALRVRSMSQLLAIGQSLAVWSDSQPDRRLPGPDEDWVRLLQEESFAVAEDFFGPGRSDGVIVYFYVPAERLTPDPNRVLLYEHPDLFEGGTNFLFHDFGQEFIPEPEATKLISELRLQDGTRWAPHEAVRLVDP